MATDGLKLATEPRDTPAGAGVEWIGEGWRLFTKAPLMWVVAILVIAVIWVAANMVPPFGTIAFQIVQPVFVAGLMVGCRSLETGGEFEIEHVFAGFKQNLGNLAVLGLISLLATFVLLLVFMLFAGFGLFLAFASGDVQDAWPAIMASGMSILFGLLVVLLLAVPLMMLFWFAPALVMLHDLTPIAAMKASFRGCLRNVVPFLVYGIVMTVLSFIAVIPLLLGLLVWFPLLATSTYAAYRMIYTEEPETAEPAIAKAA
jgi:uncharacterized membrane protein